MVLHSIIITSGVRKVNGNRFGTTIINWESENYITCYTIEKMIKESLNHINIPEMEKFKELVKNAN